MCGNVTLATELSTRRIIVANLSEAVIVPRFATQRPRARSSPAVIHQRNNCPLLIISKADKFANIDREPVPRDRAADHRKFDDSEVHRPW
jgi:hypothetical protein